MRRSLYIFIQITGHHIEYLSHLVNYLLENGDTEKHIFVVHPDISNRLSSIVDRAEHLDSIEWVPLRPIEVQSFMNASKINRSFKGFHIANHYAIKYQVDHVFLSNFNVFQPALIVNRPSYTISGILFAPFPRMTKNNWREKLKYYRKHLTIQLLTFNRKITGIHILNDERTADYLNLVFKTNIYSMLADPIPKLEPLKNFDVHANYHIGKNRKIFLHIGSLSPRKGTFEILDAVYSIPRKEQNKIAILLVGKADNKSTERIIKDKVQKANAESDIQLIWDNDFVSNEMMKSLFEQCYAVLMPYKNAHASSGILGHAAASNKMVIAPGRGLLKEVVEKFELGVLLDEITSPNIAGSIAKLVIDQHKKPSTRNGMGNFVRRHDPSFFCRAILNQQITYKKTS